MLHGTRRPLPPLGAAAAISDVIIHLILMKVMLDLGGSKTHDRQQPLHERERERERVCVCVCVRVRVHGKVLH